MKLRDTLAEIIVALVIEGPLMVAVVWIVLLFFVAMMTKPF